MKRFICILAAALLVSSIAFARGFGDCFTDATLRLDYIFSGNATESSISFLQAYRTSGWAGRRGNLDSLLLAGNGRIEVLDPESGEVLYCQSFSTLFQEWQCTEEATHVTKGFENCFQVPWPKRKVNVRVTLTDNYHRVKASLTHPVDPSDILIRPLKTSCPWRQIRGGGNHAGKVDVAILGDGYAEKDLRKFWNDAAKTAEALLSHEPFASLKDKFNFVAVAAPSEDSGVSVPHMNSWKRTAFGSHYDTFYTDRYLTTSNQRAIFDALAGVPFEIMIILGNTDKYGGGGIYNSVTLVSAGHRTFRVVTVHEFGHAFAGLGDEYFYDDDYSDNYPDGVEPWEPNITTRTDFASKWEDLVNEGVAGLYEGGGYRSKGIWRPAEDCRMRTNECEGFCPVCTRAIIRMTEYLTENSNK